MKRLRVFVVVVTIAGAGCLEREPAPNLMAQRDCFLDALKAEFEAFRAANETDKVSYLQGLGIDSFVTEWSIILEVDRWHSGRPSRREPAFCVSAGQNPDESDFRSDVIVIRHDDTDEARTFAEAVKKRMAAADKSFDVRLLATSDHPRNYTRE
jgi:hypothetical protein